MKTSHKLLKLIDIVCFNNIKLTDTVFLPTFSPNLVCVNKLIITNVISCTFFPHFSTLQDQKNKKIPTVGRVVGSLYCLDQSSFSYDVLRQFNSSDIFQQFVT